MRKKLQNFSDDSCSFFYKKHKKNIFLTKINANRLKSS